MNGEDYEQDEWINFLMQTKQIDKFRKDQNKHWLRKIIKWQKILKQIQNQEHNHNHEEDDKNKVSKKPAKKVEVKKPARSTFKRA